MDKLRRYVSKKYDQQKFEGRALVKEYTIATSPEPNPAFSAAKWMDSNPAEDAVTHILSARAPTVIACAIGTCEGNGHFYHCHAEHGLSKF
jgi:hypothetical protein